MGLDKWAERQEKSAPWGGERSPEEKKAAKKEADKAAKKERALAVKTTRKAAEAASEKADKFNTPQFHKEAAAAHDVAEKAAHDHYYNSRNSRNTNEMLHMEMGAHRRERAAHLENAEHVTAKANEAGSKAFAAENDARKSRDPKVLTAVADLHMKASDLHRQAAAASPGEKDGKVLGMKTPGTHDSWRSYHAGRDLGHANDGDTWARKAVAAGGDDKWARDAQGRFTSK